MGYCLLNISGLQPLEADHYRFAQINPKILQYYTLNNFCTKFKTSIRKLGLLADKKRFGWKSENLIHGVHVWY